MVGQVRVADIQAPPEAGTFRLWAGSYQRGQPVYEDDAVLQVQPEQGPRAAAWLTLALASRAPHSLEVG